MTSYTENKFTRTYKFSNNALRGSSLKVSENHVYERGKSTFTFGLSEWEQIEKLYVKAAVDIDELRLSSSQLESELALALIGRCPSNRWSKVLDISRLPQENPKASEFEKEIVIDFDENSSHKNTVPKEKITKRIELYLAVFLNENKGKGSDIIARRSNQILSDKKFSVSLEKTGSGFETVFESFSNKLDLPSESLWYLEFNSFEDPPEETITIYLNKDQEKLTELLHENAKNDESLSAARHVLLKSISFDAFSDLIFKLLDELIEDEEAFEEEENCLGNILKTELTEELFKDEISNIVNFYQTNPDKFKTELQEKCNLKDLLTGVG